MLKRIQRISQTVAARLFEDLENLFTDMDAQYNRAAKSAKSQCTGCEDNCCRSLFYHHTLSELLYLQKGFGELPRWERTDIAGHTKIYVERMAETDGKRGSRKQMCPANTSGRCRIYRHRPMICRLHGIPHTLRLPNGQIVQGPGCREHENIIDPDADTVFDRTPFYEKLAEIETNLRKRTGFHQKLKLTVADMLIYSGGV